MKRYHELDSLRGIAALAVIFGHYMNIFHHSVITNSIEYGPLRFLVSGTESVILFFVLSGFVLSLPFINNNESGYYSFIVRRIFRIYVPYLIVILLSILASRIFYAGNIAALSSWFNNRGDAPFTWNLFWQHIILIGSFNNAEYNPVIWSLMQEMRISLIFPLLMWVVIRLSWKNNLLLILGMIATNILIYNFIKLLPADVGSTFFYISMFIGGSLLARYRNTLIRYFAEFSLNRKAVVLTVGLFLYYFMKPSFALNLLVFPGMKDFYRNLIDEPFVAIGASMIIIISLGSKRISKLLLKKQVHFLGKISYSLYLFHAVILITLIQILYGEFPIYLILLLSFLITIFISSISYFYLELPAIKIGKKLSNINVSYIYHSYKRKRHEFSGPKI